MCCLKYRSLVSQTFVDLQKFSKVFARVACKHQTYYEIAHGLIEAGAPCGVNNGHLACMRPLNPRNAVLCFLNSSAGQVAHVPEVISVNCLVESGAYITTICTLARRAPLPDIPSGRTTICHG